MNDPYVTAGKIRRALRDITEHYDAAGNPPKITDDSEKRGGDQARPPTDVHAIDCRADTIRHVSFWVQFILDEVAKKEQIGVEQQELSEHLMRRAQQSGQDPNEFAKHMVEHNHIPEMVSEVVRGKALAIIVEGAQVVDDAGNPVELKNLRPDGTIGEPEAAQAEDAQSEAAQAEDEAPEAETAEPAEPADA